MFDRRTFDPYSYPDRAKKPWCVRLGIAREVTMDPSIPRATAVRRVKEATEVSISEQMISNYRVRKAKRPFGDTISHLPEKTRSVISEVLWNPGDRPWKIASRLGVGEGLVRELSAKVEDWLGKRYYKGAAILDGDEKGHAHRELTSRHRAQVHLDNQEGMAHA